MSKSTISSTLRALSGTYEDLAAVSDGGGHAEAGDLHTELAAHLRRLADALESQGVTVTDDGHVAGKQARCTARKVAPSLFGPWQSGDFLETGLE